MSEVVEREGAIEFDEAELSFASKPVRIGKKWYTLREADEGAAVQYRSAGAACARFNPDTGKPERVEGLAALQPLLVSLCLYDNEKDQRVSLEFVKKLPPRIVKKLYEEAQVMSHLIEGEETLETLLEQLAALEAKIDRFRAEEEALGNSQRSTVAT